MSFSPDFDLTTETDADGAVVKVRGELDSGTCAAVEAACREAIALPALAQLTLDLERVSFIDSAGMRSMILIERLADERDVPIFVLPPPDDVTELLRTAGVAGRMTFSAQPPTRGRHAQYIERIELELPPEPMSPSRARAEVRELMSGHQCDSDAANLVLLTSEVVTNAVVHPRTAVPAPICLRIISYENGVRVEVEDSGDGFDPAAPPGSPEQGGRGLFLVDSCAASWGTSRVEGRRGRRFCVWFELDWNHQPATAG
jgi:anti-anti-sigma factor